MPGRAKPPLAEPANCCLIRLPPGLRDCRPFPLHLISAAVTPWNPGIGTASPLDVQPQLLSLARAPWSSAGAPWPDSSFPGPTGVPSLASNRYPSCLAPAQHL